ncbi:MAG: glycosyltransferase family 4 protein [Clostridiales bacterium]|nr:glycosyltransferase family 4 protein [Clostridiales bacterium]
MIKVIHIISDHAFGGAGRYLLNILKYRNKEKFEVKVINHGKGQLYEKILEDSDVHACYLSASIKPTSFDIRLFIKIFIMLNKEKPHIVHVHGSLAGRLAAKLVGSKIVMTKHWKQRSVNKRILKWTTDMLTDRIIAISNVVANSLKKSGVKDEAIKVIHNGIDVDFFDGNEDNGLYSNCGYNNFITIGMVARIEIEKDHETYLRAAKKITDENENVKFFIVGKGSREKTIKEMAKELGIDHSVVFMGFVNNIKEVIKQLDICVLTSTNEAFGLVLTEGMVLGKPIVATNLEAIREVVAEAGLYFTPRNSDMLAEKLQLLIDDKKLRKKLGEIGRERVVKLFDVKMMVYRLEELYEEIM